MSSANSYKYVYYASREINTNYMHKSEIMRKK